MKLIPPDFKQCQAEKPNGVNPFTLGGKFEYIRCKNKPTVVAREKKKPNGEMTLCDDCLKVLLEQQPNVATIKRIQNEKQQRK